MQDWSRFFGEGVGLLFFRGKGNPGIACRYIYPAFKLWRITITPRARLLKPCQVVVDQPRTLDLNRFGDGPLTILAPEEMAAVEKSLKGVLGRL